MSVHAGQEAEYIRRHQPIWQDLERTLIEHGVRTYSIFLDRTTNHLFGYVEFESEAQWNAIAATDVCQRWWAEMRDLMPTNADHSPLSVGLEEVFHIERLRPERGAKSPSESERGWGPASSE
jgi:L-rhamnose mutarotase